MTERFSHYSPIHHDNAPRAYSLSRAGVQLMLQEQQMQQTEQERPNVEPSQPDVQQDNPGA